jgi:hypothetical protein
MFDLCCATGWLRFMHRLLGRSPELIPFHNRRLTFKRHLIGARRVVGLTVPEVLPRRLVVLVTTTVRLFAKRVNSFWSALEIQPYLFELPRADVGPDSPPV